MLKNHVLDLSGSLGEARGCPGSHFKSIWDGFGSHFEWFGEHFGSILEYHLEFLGSISEHVFQSLAMLLGCSHIAPGCPRDAQGTIFKAFGIDNLRKSFG